MHQHTDSEFSLCLYFKTFDLYVVDIHSSYFVLPHETSFTCVLMNVSRTSPPKHEGHIKPVAFHYVAVHGSSEANRPTDRRRRANCCSDFVTSQFVTTGESRNIFNGYFTVELTVLQV